MFQDPGPSSINSFYIIEKEVELVKGKGMWKGEQILTVKVHLSLGTLTCGSITHGFCQPCTLQ